MDAPQEPRGPGRPKKTAVAVTSRRNAALARRLAPGASPFGGGSRSIPLKEPQVWHTRIENDFAEDGAVFRAIHELGWEAVTVEDLACKPEDVGLRLNEAGYLTRGAQGKEVLLKMRREDFDEVMKRKTDYNNRSIGSSAKVKSDAANAAAATFGPEAADFVHNVVGEVKDTTGPLSQA